MADNTSLFIMPEERSIDIDTELDFEIVKFLMKNNTEPIIYKTY